MREDNPFDDPAHFELPAHVFLPSHPITAEPGLREATAYLTLHSNMLKAHAMAKQSWADASRDDDSFFTAVDDSVFTAVDDLDEKGGIDMNPAHDDDLHDDRSSLLPPRRPTMTRGRATYDGMSTFGVASKWSAPSRAAASDTSVWLLDAADDDRTAALDAHARAHDGRTVDLSERASLHSIFHGHVARRPPNARRATSASYTFRKPSAPSRILSKPNASSSKLSVPSYTRRNTSTSCVGAKRERKASMASAHFNEIHEKIHRWGIKTHLEDEDEDVVPLIGRDEDEEVETTESNSSTSGSSSPTSADPFTSDSEDDSSSTSRSSSPTSTASHDEVSPSPRRPWWKRVVSCNGLLGKRMRYSRLG
ncbi:hypothetical protein K525DRAFT_249208 [Schizophyllum commune Loenen D]|nr:hypothetical protein K525DRAFT_249208 [Schizophyllum commune Loenen D]